MLCIGSGMRTLPWCCSILRSFRGSRAVIWFHLVTALVATGLGLTSLLLPKGTQLHRLTGRLWMGLMLCATLSSFLIHTLHPPGRWSWLHGLSLYTLISMAQSIGAVRQGNLRRHADCMKGVMVGAIAAGTAAFIPGRFLAGVLGY